MLAIEKVIILLGGLQATAGACGVTYQAVQRWLRKGVPPARAVQLEILSNGAYSRRELCPTFPWDAASHKEAA